MEINRDFYGCFGKLKHRSNPTAIVIHHTCTSSHKRTRQSLKSKGYSTHFEVEKDGTIYQYADPGKDMCCHCGSSNFTTIGIDVTHVENAEWPEEQIKSVSWLVNMLCIRYAIPQKVHEELSGIYPHKALGQTACPQDFPMDRLERE